MRSTAFGPERALHSDTRVAASVTSIVGTGASSLPDANPGPRIAELERELTSLGNSIGMGAMGFVGSSMVVDCHIEVGYTRTVGMPMSVHTFCLSSRRATARLHTDGRVEYRTNPNWFTPYMRRETVEWQMTPAS